MPKVKRILEETRCTSENILKYCYGHWDDKGNFFGGKLSDLHRIILDKEVQTNFSACIHRKRNFNQAGKSGAYLLVHPNSAKDSKYHCSVSVAIGVLHDLYSLKVRNIGEYGFMKFDKNEKIPDNLYFDHGKKAADILYFDKQYITISQRCYIEENIQKQTGQPVPERCVNPEHLKFEFHEHKKTETKRKIQHNKADLQIITFNLRNEIASEDQVEREYPSSALKKVKLSMASSTVSPPSVPEEGPPVAASPPSSLSSSTYDESFWNGFFDEVESKTSDYAEKTFVEFDNFFSK